MTKRNFRLGQKVWWITGDISVQSGLAVEDFQWGFDCDETVWNVFATKREAEKKLKQIVRLLS